jgi:hypothetical protein
VNPPRNRKGETGNPPPTAGASDFYPNHREFFAFKQHAPIPSPHYFFLSALKVGFSDFCFPFSLVSKHLAIATNGIAQLNWKALK